MRFKTLGPTGERIGGIGQGCSGIGGGDQHDSSEHDAEQIRTLQLGLDLGMNLIDTAEVYGNGHSEEVVGQAITGRRDHAFIATKVATEHLAYDDVLAAAEGSLRRLGIETIDLYQVHWPNPKVPIEETMRAMERLLRDGKVRYVGVSNFSLRELRNAQAALPSQVLVSLEAEYNLSERSVEEHLLPYCEAQRLSLIAYSPLDRGRVASNAQALRALDAVAQRYGKTVAQVVLAWLVHHPAVLAIPRASAPQHLRENAAAAELRLEASEMEEIERLFAQRYAHVATERIRVVTQPEHPAPQTLEEALENRLGVVPSPQDLAQDLLAGEILKPVRLVSTTDPSGRFDYDLVDGRTRYWAWVIAYQGARPIPARVRDG